MEYLQEFPLVFFTLLVQMAVGMVLVGKCVLGNEADRALREGVRRQNVAALLLFAVAVVISFVHLGTPLHAPFTLLHVMQSWLSREILMIGLVGLALLWLLGAAAALTIVRLVRGPTLPDRVLALDLLNALAMSMLAVFAARSALWLYFDLAIALALVGFLSTVAFARSSSSEMLRPLLRNAICWKRTRSVS